MNEGQKIALVHPNIIGAGAKKRKKLKGKEKIPVVMHEWKKGTLHSGNGEIVENQKQAVAIALSEAGMLKPKARFGFGGKRMG